MYAGKQVEKAGIWCCYFHRKNKITLSNQSTFPRCDFAGVKCDGPWFLVREIKIKTHEEVHAARNNQRQQQIKMRGRDKDFLRKLKEPKVNKWDFEKW
jgi:hypothetical protein